MLVSSLSLLKKARAHHYAIPAFNVNNLEILQAVMEAATSLKSPVIVQTSEGAISYAGLEMLVAMVRTAAVAKIPVVLHLDHGKDLNVLKAALKAGYTSVMFDGSALPYAKNKATTKQVVGWAHAKKVAVEAELGVLAGIEDFVRVEDRDAKLTNPEQAADFVRFTGCDSLAVAIGTSHGAYKFSAKGGSAFDRKNRTHLDIDRLQKIAALVKQPLVLHGASGVLEDVTALAEHYGADLGAARGVLDEDIKKAIHYGVAKVNIDTDLRLAFTAGIREAVADLPRVIDPRKLLQPAKDLMTEVAKRKMTLFGSAGKA